MTKFDSVGEATLHLLESVWKLRIDGVSFNPEEWSDADLRADTYKQPIIANLIAKSTPAVPLLHVML
jgi:hypothetical protein